MKPRILVVDGATPGEAGLAEMWEHCEPVSVRSIWRGLKLLAREPFAGVYVGRDHLQHALQVGHLLQNDRILENMPDGVALLSRDLSILWANSPMRCWAHDQAIVGRNFLDIFPTALPAAEGSCPFDSALSVGQTTTFTFRVEESDGERAAKYLRVHATPVRESEEPPEHLIVVARDVSVEMLQQQKLVAIHKAGVELADLTADELASMSVEERINLLKDNILRFTKDLLKFDVIEVRLLDRDSAQLAPLLAVGMAPEAMARALYASETGNGVTGYVAATGNSYLCTDTAKDPRYLEGAKGAKSSLTVPLLLHDEVIGTFNVESPHINAFSESDLQFLEIFARDVAAALHTLELLVAEKLTTTAKSIEAIHSAVALPIDDILNDAVSVMESYIGHGAEVVERLSRILRNARDIKQVIQKVGRTMSPSQALPVAPESYAHPKLLGHQVLVVDADDEVRGAAHKLLERYGCVVETAHDGGEAISMARVGAYNAIISDIRLPDMSGYNLLTRLQEFLDTVPMILMTGFGWDPGHTIVKARQAGVRAFLYKPFRLDQLLDTLERLEPIPGRSKEAL